MMDFYQSGATAAGFNPRGSMSADNRASSRRAPADEATPATPKKEQPPNDDEINRFRGKIMN